MVTETHGGGGFGPIRNDLYPAPVRPMLERCDVVVAYRLTWQPVPQAIGKALRVPKKHSIGVGNH